MNRMMRIALALAVATLAASSGATAVRSGPETYEVSAFFDRAIGLFPRSTVRVLGVEVGRIAKVTPEGDRVRVDMSIREDVKVPRDASAIIVPISLISDRYVQLAPAYTGGPTLGDGDAIPLERGMAPAELDDLLATLKGFLEALEPGTVDEPGALGQLITNAERALGGKGPELGKTIEGLATLLDTLARNAQHFDNTLVSLDSVVAALARKDAELAIGNRGLASVFSALAEEQEHLERGVGNLAGVVKEAGDLVRAHRSDLEADLQTLASATQAIINQRDAFIRNTLWLPVLAEGARKAWDEDDRRVNVRDNQGVRFDAASGTFEPVPLGRGPGVGGTWLLWPEGGRW